MHTIKNNEMKNLKFASLFALSISLFSCKKDYFCSANAVVKYDLGYNNNSSSVLSYNIDFIQDEVCINCSKKDSEKIEDNLDQRITNGIISYNKNLKSVGWETVSFYEISRIITCEDE